MTEYRMSERSNLTLFSYWLVLLNCFSLHANTEKGDRKPNIILIMADDLGYGELGCYGQTKIETPNIDQIADEGIKFSQFYSGQTVCAPSRCSLLTGLHQGHAQIRDNSSHLSHIVKQQVKEPFPGQFPINENTTTIGHLLQDQGYKTGCVGKWGLGHPKNSGDPNKQGFDFFYGYICQVQAHNFYPRYLWRNDKKEKIEGNDRKLVGENYSADLMDTECLNFIKENKDDPFFLYYATPLPHLALQVPEKDLVQYKGKWKADKPYDGKDNYLPHDHPRAAYAAMVSHLDRAVGEIVALVDELGLADDTIIIFTSDNGATYLGGYDLEFFKGSGPLNGRKGDLYEGGIRVPTVVKWPGKIKPGTESDHIAASWDLMATISEITEVECPITDGVSFLSELIGKKQKEHDHLYWEFHGYGGWQVVRKGDWKAIRKDMISKKNMKLELYNLKDDLGEKHDLSGKYPEIVKEMEVIMIKEHVPNGYFPLRLLGDSPSTHLKNKN